MPSFIWDHVWTGLSENGALEAQKLLWVDSTPSRFLDWPKSPVWLGLNVVWCTSFWSLFIHQFCNRVLYIGKVVVCTAKLSYFRCSPDVISTASSGRHLIDVSKIKVHYFHCSKAVEVWRVEQMAVNFTAFCQIVAYILKVVFSMTISCNKYDF